HYVATFKGGNGPLTTAIGLKKVSGEKIDFNAEQGTMTSWQRQEKLKGMQGLGIIVNPKAVVKQTDDAKNNLLIAETEANGTISYWTGFAWDQAGHIADQ